ncbi:MAG: DoxX family protein [bacterium]|nr:DoxX family protein [bacterium]
MESISPMKNSLPRFLLTPWIFHSFRLFMGGLFLYTGATKLADIAGFSQSIAAYGILPAVLLPCAAIGLPALEVVVGFGTLLNKRWALLGILAMMVMFTGVLGYGVAVGLEIDCGCFSTAETSLAEKSETASILDIPGDGSSLFNEPGIFLETVEEGNGAEETCSEPEEAPPSLRSALIRDIFLLFGVIYLVAWPDLRQRWGINRSRES